MGSSNEMDRPDAASRRICVIKQRTATQTDERRESGLLPMDSQRQRKARKRYHKGQRRAHLRRVTWKDTPAGRCSAIFFFFV